MKTGVELIAAERKRQVEEEGWTPDHDAKWIFGELARAAGAYADDAGHRIKNKTWGQRHLEYPEDGAHPDWPWTAKWWKATPGDDVRQLVKAGALIAAEVDRLQRGSVRIIKKCFRCGVELTPENDSGWEVFTGAKEDPPPAGQDYLGATAPICKACDEEYLHREEKK